MILIIYEMTPVTSTELSVSFSGRWWSYADFVKAKHTMARDGEGLFADEKCCKGCKPHATSLI